MDVRMTMKAGKRAWHFGLWGRSFLLEGLSFSEIRKLPLMVSIESKIIKVHP